MKIAYISNSYLPSRAANAVHVLKMANALTKLGHSVNLIVRTDNPRLAGSDVARAYGLSASFQITPVRELPIRRWKLVYGLIAAVTARLGGAELVYTRHPSGACFAVLLGCRVIYEAHTPLKGRGSRWLFQRFVRSRRLQRVVVITHALADAFQREYPELAGKLVVAPDGADPPDGGFLPSLDKGAVNPLKVGYIGHLYPGKGMELIAELAKLCPWALFNVIGGTEQDLEHWRGRAQHIWNIRFHGHVDHDEALRRAQQNHVLIAPYGSMVSIASGEDISKWMSPLKIFEYMAVGRPIVATSLPVLREVLDDGVNALLCAPDELDQWVDALKQLAMNGDLRHRLSANAYDGLIREFSWSVRAERVIGCAKL